MDNNEAAFVGHSKVPRSGVSKSLFDRRSKTDRDYIDHFYIPNRPEVSKLRMVEKNPLFSASMIGVSGSLP